MKERLGNLPGSEQHTEINLGLINLLTDKDEDLHNPWQDKKFAFAFPSIALYLASSNGQKEFTKDEIAQIFSNSLQTFLSNNNRKLAGYMFTKNGEIVTKNSQGLRKTRSINESQPISHLNSSDTIRLEEGEKIDSYSRTVTALILLIGMSLKDPEMLTSLMIQVYQNLSSEKRNYLIDNLGRLLATDNPTRAYIKDKKYDTGNGFGWDEELAHVLFFGIYKGVQRPKRQRLPQETKDIMLKYYSLETLNVILDYALDQAKHLQRLTNSEELTGFIDYMATLLANNKDRLPQQKMIEDMQEKLDGLKEALSYKKFESPDDPNSSPSGKIDYARTVRRSRSS